ncbi:MAG: (2Fe-2S)-binding protein [Spirosomataceae bacterium]|jgi:isoquinoline 1-oxidoreductase alpha subunit
MAQYNLKINGKVLQVEADPTTPVLWVLRDNLKMLGTKFGCGIAQCGACTIHIDGTAMRSCVYPVSAVDGQSITTIEGIAEGGEMNKIQKAWLELDVPQCGYCQAGQIMSATALLKENPNPSDQDIDDAMQGNICRCGTYTRIKKAIKTAANS